MKHKLFCMLGFIVLAWVGFAASLAGATTAAGPYYANPSWDQQLPASTRFIVLSNWGSAAVLDRETGLVWERSPTADTFVWVPALQQCRNHQTGSRRSWRLPSYDELTSLLDPTQANPALPVGHPFQGIGAFDEFWTASTDESDDNFAYIVQIGFGGTWTTAAKTNFTLRIWCVRGGSGVDNPR
jgi:uncharacterized protein DUF1566